MNTSEEILMLEKERRIQIRTNEYKYITIKYITCIY